MKKGVITINATIDEEIKRYINEIERIKVLKSNEINCLFAEYALLDGEEKINVRNKIINSNLLLVARIILEKYSNNSNFFELIQMANLHLIDCIESYDYENSGVIFSVYVVRHIRTYLKLSSIEELDFEYYDSLFNKTNSSTELVSLDAYLESDQTSYKYNSSVRPLEDGYIDTLKDEMLYSVIDNKISERGQEIIYRRFGLLENDPGTLEQISKDVKLTRSRVGQIIDNILKQLESSEKIRFIKNLENNQGNLENMFDREKYYYMYRYINRDSIDGILNYIARSRNFQISSEEEYNNLINYYINIYRYSGRDILLDIYNNVYDLKKILDFNKIYNDFYKEHTDDIERVVLKLYRKHFIDLNIVYGFSFQDYNNSYSDEIYEIVKENIEIGLKEKFHGKYMKVRK